MTPRVLMVCTGNICRSAMAKVVLEQQAERAGISVEVDSAGISNEEQGNPMDRRAARTLQEAGYEVPFHSARKITGSDLEDFDLILAMTDGHFRGVSRLAQQVGFDRDELAEKLFMYRSFDPQASGSLDVPDPWYGNMSDFLETLETVEAVTPPLMNYIEESVAS